MYNFFKAFTFYRYNYTLTQFIFQAQNTNENKLLPMKKAVWRKISFIHYMTIQPIMIHLNTLNLDDPILLRSSFC